MPDPTLNLPSKRCETSYREALAEAHAEGRHFDIDLIGLDFDHLLEKLEGERRGDHLPPGCVPQTTLWLELEGKYLGRVAIRHMMNETLLLIGGHIGYDIRPSERRAGFGTIALRLALPRARKLGLKRVLITCDDDNVASRRIIERNGGLFENAVDHAGVRKLRFWVDLKS